MNTFSDNNRLYSRIYEVTKVLGSYDCTYFDFLLFYTRSALPNDSRTLRCVKCAETLK